MVRLNVASIKRLVKGEKRRSVSNVAAQDVAQAITNTEASHPESALLSNSVAATKPVQSAQSHAVQEPSQIATRDDQGEDADHPRIIAVMGATGSGKSSFVKAMTGDPTIVVGKTLHSMTRDIMTYEMCYNDKRFLLADTPGFDDTEVSNMDILRDLSRWLQQTFVAGSLLSGIIYLHAVTETRLTSSTQRTLALFDKLCGRSSTTQILLVTTFWNLIDDATGSRREKELGEIDGVWKGLKDSGAKIERMGIDYDRFRPILYKMAKDPAMQIQLQEEVKQGLDVADTMAGLVLEPAIDIPEAQSPVSPASPSKINSNGKLESFGDTKESLEDQALCDREQEVLKQAQKEDAAVLERLNRMHAETIKQMRTKLSAEQTANSKPETTPASETAAQRDETEAKLKAMREREQEELDRMQREHAAKLRELDRLHADAIRMKAEELKAKQNHQAQMQADAWHARNVNEKTIFDQWQQGASRSYAQASSIQRSQVNESINYLSMLHRLSGSWLRVNKATSNHGLGHLGTGGLATGGYGVSRLGLNIWCDVCRCPMGIFEYFRCRYCPGDGFQICQKCHQKGKGCTDRSHVLEVQSTGIVNYGGLACQRATRPTQGLTCSLCRGILQGLYFHCCQCDRDDFDICTNCISSRRYGCNQSFQHALDWGVLPVALPWSATSAIQDYTAVKIELRQPTFWIEAMRKRWKGPTSRNDIKNLVMFELILWQKQDMVLAIRAIESAISGRWLANNIKGTLGDILTFCVGCFNTTGPDFRWDCKLCLAGGTYTLCSACYQAGLRCFNKKHEMAMSISAMQGSICARERNPPSKLVCSWCRAAVKHAYFHCCFCESDDYDLCWECVFLGRFCKYGHQLRLNWVSDLGPRIQEINDKYD